MTGMHRGFLDDCEKEQLHKCGAIQSHGALVAVSKGLELNHYSENFAVMLGLEPSDFVDALQQRQLLPALSSLSNLPGTRVQLEAALETQQGIFDLIITRGGQEDILLEFFNNQLDCPEWITPPSFKSHYDMADLPALRQQLVSWIANVSGFERVMYYQFLEAGDGEVIAEVTQSKSQSSSQGSYLGLRFPASDIPQIARQLYLKNPWRTIQDATASSVNIVGHSPVDLTWSDLRSVSPIHVIYMQNMGDRSSLSVPISTGKELDALISCHSHHAKKLPLQRLTAIHEVVEEYNILLRNLVTTQRVRLVDEIAHHTHSVLQRLENLGEQQSQWQIFSDWLLQEFEADIVVWCHHDTLLTAGEGLSTVTETENALIDQLDEWFLYHCDDLVFFKDQIRPLLTSDLLTHIAGAAGLRVRMKDTSNARLYLLRVEQVDEVLWGGNPDKPVEYHDGMLGITPRRSFGKWVEKRIGFSRAWGNSTRLRLLRLRDELQRFTSSNEHWLTNQGDQ